MSELKRIAGIQSTHLNTDWILLSEKMMCKKQKKDRSGKMYFEEESMCLPFRSFNFEYAFYKKKYNFKEAIEYTKQKLFNASGEPIYLPEHLYSLDFNMKYRNYKNILDTVKKEFYNI